MKKYILIFILIIISFNIKAQKYTPFNLETGIWQDHTFNPNGGNFMDDYSTYYTKGDSVVNSIKYTKLFCYNIITYSHIPLPSYTTFYWGLIRNDTLNKQIKVIRFNQSTEKILYNFNLKIGDALFDNNNTSAKITYIDSIKICNKFYKRFKTNKQTVVRNFNDSSKVVLIEGIGFNCGFIEPFFEGFEYYKELACYTERNNNDCEQCADWTVEIKDNVTINKKPSIIYYQQLKEINIKRADNIKSIKLISITGNIIKEWNNCESNCRLALKSLVKGVYVVSCIFNNGSVVNKKIVVV